MFDSVVQLREARQPISVKSAQVREIVLEGDLSLKQ